MARRRRIAAALVALLPLSLLLLVLSPGVAQANTTQSNGCLGVTGTFSEFAVPITGTASPNPADASVPTPVTLSGTSVTIGVDSALIGAGVTTGLVSAADSLADIGVTANDGTPSATAGVNAVTGAIGSVKLKISGSNTAEGVQTASNTAAISLTFYVTADSSGGSVVVYSAISSPPAAAPDPTRTGTVLVGALNVPIPLGNTTWTPVGGTITFAEQNVAPSSLTTPTLADKQSAPLVLQPKINSLINVPFFCWPGTVNTAVTPSPLVPGASAAIDTVTVNGSSSTSSTSSTTSSTSSTSSTTTTSTTTTTTAPRPTTTLPATISGTGAYVTQCKNSVTPDLSTLTFHLSATAPSTVTAGNTVTLTNQSWKIDVPGSVLTAGINLGLLNAGDVVAGVVNPAVFASNTKEGTQTAPPVTVAIGPIAVDGVTGAALDTTTTFSVPNMTWTAVGGDVGYTLAQTVMQVTIGPLKVTFTCTPAADAAAFLVSKVSGQTTIPPAAKDGTTAAGTAVEGAQLARTGYSPLFPLVLGLTILDLGYLMWSAARPPRRRHATS